MVETLEYEWEVKLSRWALLRALFGREPYVRLTVAGRVGEEAPAVEVVRREFSGWPLVGFEVDPRQGGRIL